MHDSNASTAKPPSCSEGSYPASAFGRSTSRYVSFLELLLAGLLEYEAGKGGAGHAPEPVPAA
jgi:hypothetical protein